MKDHAPLEGRIGFTSESPESNALAKAVGQVARAHGLLGCVFISFTSDRVGVNSSGLGEFANQMEALADGVLAEIDDGVFDPELGGFRNPRAQQLERIAQRLYDLRDSCPCERDGERRTLDDAATLLTMLAAEVESAAKVAKKGGKK